MTFGSLFTGAGGFDLGFEKAGLQCAWQCEIDRTASEVLRHRWPDVPKFDDVRACGGNNLFDVDILVGGFPCQDLSVAGNRGGLAGERSGLFYELARIARELRPGFLVWENVPGLLSSDDGRDFARVLRHLGDIGYRGAWRVLDAQHFGVPQQRRRVFGVFARGRFGAERSAEVLALAEGVRGYSPSRRVSREIVAALTANGVGTCGADDNQAQAGHIGIFGGGYTRGERRVAATLTTENQRNDFDSENFVMSYRTPAVGLNNTVRRLTPRECERLQGWPDDHTRYGDEGREIADGPRYRMIGNGVAMPCAEWIGRRLMEASS